MLDPIIFSSSITFVTMVLHICMLGTYLDNKNENVNLQDFNFCQDSCFCKTMAKGQAFQCTNQLCTCVKMPHMHHMIKQNNQQKLLFQRTYKNSNHPLITIKIRGNLVGNCQMDITQNINIYFLITSDAHSHVMPTLAPNNLNLQFRMKISIVFCLLHKLSPCSYT